jgi:hypothetical protein
MSSYSYSPLLRAIDLSYRIHVSHPFVRWLFFLTDMRVSDWQDTPHFHRFVLAERQQLNMDPANADQTAQFLTQHEAIETGRNKRKARAKKNFKERQSQLEAEHRQIIAEIDKETKAEQDLLKDRYGMQRNIAIPFVPTSLSGHQQSARPILDSVAMSPPPGFERMSSQQSEQPSVADNSLYSFVPQSSSSALDLCLATNVSRVTRASVSPYEPVSPPAQDADAPAVFSEFNQEFLEVDFGNQFDDLYDVAEDDYSKSMRR